eukprot:TRINITY_DN2031_c0_g1_i3.p1 TRINITY_DN2031_c0_g1~~TRINITY_DN2031_c0_g1_i3.p1  ORF type:complete len:242 (+),score=26.79 TRINITY_DN2031_c0_g1_i3:75-800(+)
MAMPGFTTIYLCLCCIGGSLGFAYGMMWAYRDLSVCDGISQRFCWDKFDNMPLTLAAGETNAITDGVDLEEDYSMMHYITAYAQGDGCRPLLSIVSQSTIDTGDMDGYGYCAYSNFTSDDPHWIMKDYSCRFNFTDDGDLILKDIGSDRTIYFKNRGNCPLTLYYVVERFSKFNFVEFANRSLIVAGLCTAYALFAICWCIGMSVSTQNDSAESFQKERRERERQNNNLSQNIAMTEYNQL